MTGKIELKWGAFIGGANLAWLYAAFYLGMRDNGLGLIQLSALIGAVISVIGYFLALRAVHRAAPEATSIENMRSGVVICGITTSIAVLAQVGYLRLIHPEYTNYIVDEIARHYESSGQSKEVVAEIVEGAQKTYGFHSCLLQAGLGAFLMGIISTFLFVALRIRIFR
tara:strand:- start:16893 stop:17396 length:504 start_codon:yes stop_codon:yes gene_type:complete